MYPLLVDEKGLLKQEYTKDGIHPNELGYQIVVNEINNLLNKPYVRNLVNKS